MANSRPNAAERHNAPLVLPTGRVQLGEHAELEPQEAQRIVKEMADSVAANWYEIARGEGVSPADCELIKGAFVYEGFW